ncbi:unnamed protein product [Boreogadus saida]
MISAVVLVVAGRPTPVGTDLKALHQFRSMIVCVMPVSWPVMDYADYGCYCGLGGCCQVHDQCYGTAMQYDVCWPIFENPYTELYSYNCKNHEVTCRASNNECEKFICECDRKAAECFNSSTWIPEHEHLAKIHCE